MGGEHQENTPICRVKSPCGYGKATLRKAKKIIHSFLTDRLLRKEELPIIIYPRVYCFSVSSLGGQMQVPSGDNIIPAFLIVSVCLHPYSVFMIWIFAWV
mmetsp:Transcript_11019/g.25600  ORF Transcript_11019/g.25600 Transcript_11019/m.25600 type:complete len:100 (-) Transcript_11019:1134-1433(-)